MPEYRYHGQCPETLASGKPLTLGTIVKLDAPRKRKPDEGASMLAEDHPHNARLIADGLLRLQPAKTTTSKGARS